MTVLQIKKKNIEAIIDDAVRILAAGGVVAFPTETSYGLAADAANPAAVRKIYRIKGREKGKPLPLIAGSFAQVARYVSLRGLMRRVAKKYWPGPVTVVAPLLDVVLAKALGVKHAAVRVPNSAIAKVLAKKFGKPITSTSANLSGTPPLFSGDAVRDAFAHRKARPDLIIDAGRLPKRAPSTIVAAEGDTIAVLRQGAVRVSLP